MDIKSLTRDASKVHADWLLEGGSISTKKGCKIYIPVRFAESSSRLAEIGGVVSTVGICAIVLDNGFYGVCSVPSKLNLSPDTINVVTVDKDDYYEFVFSPGAIIMKSDQLVASDTVPYYVYSEIVAKGNIPWYLTYEDLGKLMVNAPKYAGVKIGVNNAIWELIIASIARQESDRTGYYRHVATTLNDKKFNPVFIALRNIIYGATSLTSRIMGSYTKQGILGALANPSTKSEGVEELLRR